MAENINISFAPNKAASESQRIADLEQYVSTLTERTKFAFASVIGDYGESNADDNMKIINMIYQTACEAVSVGVPCGDGSSVWFNISAGGGNQPGTNVDSNVSYSCIGGCSNQAHTQCYTINITGDSNAAYASSFSSISGQFNTVKGDMHSTINGMDNAATSTARCIISGNGNKVTNSDGSVVSGQQNTVTGNFSVIVANGAEVSGSDNIIVGEQHTVNGSMNAVFGNNNTVKGSKNIVSGDCNNATDDNSVVLGTSNTAKNGSSYIVGSVNKVTGMNFVYGMGNTVSGAHNIAIGEWLKIDNSDNINDYSRTAIGTYMDTEQLESYDGRWRFVIADGNYDNPHNLIYAIEDADGKRKLYFGCDIDLPSASDTALGAVKAGENISISADGTISVDLSNYLQSTDISDWAKAESKPTYTAEEVGAAAKSHTHTKSEITDFPTLGTAAGKNAADFYPAKAASVLGGDYNELKTNGIFEMQGNAANPTANTPNGSHVNNNFYVQVFYRNPKYLTQIATSVRADKTQYIRSLNNGVWNNWEKIKSGDADTLDGKHASDIAADITAAVNAVEIGGRNLLYYSRFDRKNPAGWAYSAVVSYTFDGTAATLTKAETTTRQFTTQASVSNGVVAANPNLLPENGCTYTISCEIMKIEGYYIGGGTTVTVRYNYTDGTVKDFVIDVLEASETAWTKYSRTFVYSSDKELSYVQFIIALGAKACGIRIKNVKFEKGNKPTDWTPAPEDDERRITNLEARVAALEAAAVSGGEV